jgi:hypothetical protein
MGAENFGAAVWKSIDRVLMDDERETNTAAGV